MTPKEFWKACEDVLDECMPCAPDNNDIQAIVACINYRIGQPPKWDNIYKCARCGKILGANHSCVDFCYHCGQKVDWDE